MTEKRDLRIFGRFETIITLEYFVHLVLQNDNLNFVLVFFVTLIKGNFSRRKTILLYF